MTALARAEQTLLDRLQPWNDGTWPPYEDVGAFRQRRGDGIEGDWTVAHRFVGSAGTPLDTEAQRCGWTAAYDEHLRPGHVYVAQYAALIVFHDRADAAWLGWLCGAQRATDLSLMEPNCQAYTDLLAELRWRYQIAQFRIAVTGDYYEPLRRTALRLGVMPAAHRAQDVLEDASQAWRSSWRRP